MNGRSTISVAMLRALVTTVIEGRRDDAARSARAASLRAVALVVVPPLKPTTERPRVVSGESARATVEGLSDGEVGMLENVTTRDKWVCLPAFLGDKPEARKADFAWSALSNACHHRAYDVGLTQDELRAHLATARAFLAAVGRALA